MYSKCKTIFLFFILFFIFPPIANAVTISISNYPSSISTEIFNIDVLVTGATNATNYLRVDLYKDGTTNYFGETYNGSDWYSGSDGKIYFPVLIQNSTASATLQAQLGNPSETDYPETGIYKLKIRRYTSSGSQSSNDSQTPVDIQINYVRPTPTATPTQTATATSTAITTATSTKTATAVPSPTKTATPLRPTGSAGQAVTSTPVEATNTPELTSTPTGIVAGTSTSKKSSILSIFFILSGLGFLGYGGYLIYNKNIDNSRKKHENS